MLVGCLHACNTDTRLIQNLVDTESGSSVQPICSVYIILGNQNIGCYRIWFVSTTQL